MKLRYILHYKIHQALEFLKDSISREEEKLKITKGSYNRLHIERVIQWHFERGLNILRYAKPDEVDPDVIDWFLDRTPDKERPDITKLKDIQKQEDQE